MNIVRDGIRFAITLHRKHVTYKLIIAELDQSELSFDKDGEEEENIQHYQKMKQTN